MTRIDHAAAALALIDGHETDPRLTIEQRVALAQVHATLAVAQTLAAAAMPIRVITRPTRLEGWAAE